MLIHFLHCLTLSNQRRWHLFVEADALVLELSKFPMELMLLIRDLHRTTCLGSTLLLGFDALG